MPGHVYQAPYEAEVLACCLFRLLKERAAEDHLFGDKDRFVTAAYKAKLEADQKWLAEERVREAIEEKNSVVKAGHMGNFYRCAAPALAPFFYGALELCWTLVCPAPPVPFGSGAAISACVE